MPKKCKKCGRRRSFKHFHKNSGRGGTRNVCKDCEYRRLNATKKRILDYIQEIKTVAKCKYCNESEPCCLEFHHLDPSKKRFRISGFWKYTSSMDVVKQEIDKCVIICSNCHKKLHIGLIHEDTDCGH